MSLDRLRKSGNLKRIILYIFFIYAMGMLIFLSIMSVRTSGWPLVLGMFEIFFAFGMGTIFAIGTNITAKAIKKWHAREGRLAAIFFILIGWCFSLLLLFDGIRRVVTSF